MNTSLAYACKKDQVVFVIPKVDPEIGILPAQARCPNCGSYLLVCEDYPKDLKICVINAMGFFRASNGMGLPNEQYASKAALEQFMIGGTIEDIVLEDLSPQRALVAYMDIKGPDDVRRRFHFATSTKGVVIFRIENIHA